MWRNFKAELHLADRAIVASYGIAGFHIEPTPVSDAVQFNTKLASGDFTDLISTAAVVAALELIRSATTLFEWSVNVDRIDALLAEAREINEHAAKSDSEE